MGKIKRKRIGYKDPRKASLRMFFKLYKSTSKLRGHTFRISEKYFTKMILQNCVYCGIQPSNPINGYLNKDGSPRRSETRVTPERALQATIKVNGLDRINNKKGYTKHNIVACCRDCNRAKSNVSLNHFLTWIDRLARFQNWRLYVK